MSDNLGMIAGLIYSALVLVSNVLPRMQVRLIFAALIFDVAAIACYTVARDWVFVGIWFAIGLVGVFLLTQAQRLVSLRAEERDAEQRYLNALAKLKDGIDGRR